jgi:hypothetical protein
MWWRDGPRTDGEREREIARLEGVRDRLLERAPRSFAFQQFLAPLMFAGYVAVFGGTLLFHPEKVGPVFIAMAIVFGLLFGRMLHKSWVRVPTRGDRWGMSERLGYEGDSPRDIQAKIDRLRAQLGAGLGKHDPAS